MGYGNNLRTMEITNRSTFCWVSNYNAHRTIDMRSIDVTPAIADRLITMVYNRVKIAAPARYKVDDSVRMNKFKTIFDKGYTPNWRTKVFKIKSKCNKLIQWHIFWKIFAENLLLEDSTNCTASLTPTWTSRWKSVTQERECSLHEIIGIWQFTQLIYKDNVL